MCVAEPPLATDRCHQHSETVKHVIFLPTIVQATVAALSAQPGGSSSGGTTVALLGVTDLGIPPSVPFLPTGGTGVVDPKVSGSGRSIDPSGATGENTRGTIGAVHIVSSVISVSDGFLGA